jgi:leucyl aminopeptidase
VWYARDLVNENAHVMNPEQIASEAAVLKKYKNMSIKILNEKELARQKFGLILAVGSGSSCPPRLIVMNYTGSPSSRKRYAIVGKGITFDAGGQNLKTSGHIETMRLDMAGAATVLATMKTIAELQPKINVVGVCVAAHNAIDGNSYFPGDIYRSYSGTTVEICNTDAEGRLVLADAISYIQKKYRLTEIIDLATLTGGILTALGDQIAGLFSNDDTLADRLFASGEKVNERLWRFPLYKMFSEAMKSDTADIRNLPKLKRGYASSITGAAFIKAFVDGSIPWAHLDIAGTAFNEGDRKGEIPPAATGFGVRLLIDHLLNK